MTATVLAALYVIGVVAALVAIGLGVKWLADRYGHVGADAGDRLVRGRAATHVALLSRTLVVTGDPVLVAGIVTPVIDANRFDVAEPREREVAAWVTALPPAAGGTRLVVRSATRAGLAEVGVVEYPWWSRFPQGARPARRAIAAAATALAASGLPFDERTRQFTAGHLPRTSDGPRRALELDAAGPVSLDEPPRDAA